MAKKNEQVNEQVTEQTNETAATVTAPVDQKIADIARAQELMTSHNNVKSPVMRILSKEWGEKSTGRIAKALSGVVGKEVRYQHVRNVLNQKMSKQEE